MRLSGVFADAFLDGFTMAGFLSRLSRPGQARRLMAAPYTTQGVHRGSVDELIKIWIQETYGVDHVPESELDTMVSVLKQTGKERNLSALARKGESHGAA